MRSESEMNIIRMAREAGLEAYAALEHKQIDWACLMEDLERFAALVAAAEREKIASQWDALHEQYMADPLRRHMMLSYEMVANLIRGRT